MGEKEMLLVVETLKEYHTMLYGAPITIYTDHKNNVFQNLKTQKVVCWCMFLEDYMLEFKYLEGEKNTVANALSRLPLTERQEAKELAPSSPTSVNYQTTMESSPQNVYYIISENEEISIALSTFQPRMEPHLYLAMIKLLKLKVRTLNYES